MPEFLTTLPLGHIGVGFIGLIVYVLTSLANPADESFASIADVFLHKGRTVLTAAIVTPVLVVGIEGVGELNALSAFCAGYLNLSILRKVTDGWQSRAKVMGN